MLNKNKDNNSNNLDKYSFSLNRSSYNDFFQFFNKKLEDKGLHLLFKQNFPIIDEQNVMKITYEGYKTEFGTYNDRLFTSRYLSYVAKLTVNFIIHVNNEKIKYDFVLQNIPIMVNNDTYFVINGTKKIFIFQLVKTGGIYYEIDSSTNTVSLVMIVSLSGSRIVLKVNPRGIIYVFVNNSKKIQIVDFFHLIDEHKRLEYLNHYKSELNIDLFQKTKSNVIKNALLFGDCFEFKFKKEGVYINCTENQVKSYLISKWNKYTYDKKTNTAFISLDDVYSCFVVKKVKSNINPKKLKQMNLKNTILINNLFKNKVMNFDDEEYLILIVVCFLSTMNIIYKSLLYYVDKNMFENSKVTTKTTVNEEQTEEDDLDLEEESDTKKTNIGSSDSFEDSSYDTSSPSIEYAIDKIIRNRINKDLKNKYSKDTLHITAEDLINLFIYFNKLILDPNCKKIDYDDLRYKKVKTPENFISNIIFRNIKSNIRYMSANKDYKHNFNDDLFGAYNCSTEIRKLFTLHPLAQFLEETNVLSVLSHIRRLCLLNLVNFEKYQSAFERDTNNSFFGKLCVIETPEGGKVGIVNAFASNANIDENGFITTPYIVIADGKKTDKVVFMNTDDEQDKVIAYFHKDFDKQSHVVCRFNDQILELPKSEVQFVDIDNKNMVSIGVALIVAIAHSAALRALMSANMNRQAVALQLKEAPIVGTGVEKIIAQKSGNLIYNLKDNRVVVNCASSYVVTADKDNYNDFEVFHIERFVKTNMKTCNHMIVSVKPGQLLNKGDIIASGSCIDKDELAIGQNLVVAIMSWYGFNFEDSIAISEIVLILGYFVSVHINEVEVKAKEIDSGVVEEFTKDNLDTNIVTSDQHDERGIIKIGEKVEPGKILVSRRVLRRPSEVSLEDNVLAAILGDKLMHNKNISYKATYEINGTVIGIDYFNRIKHTQDSTYYNNLEKTELEVLKCIVNTLVIKLPKEQKIFYNKLLLECEQFEEIPNILKSIKNLLKDELKNSKNIKKLLEIFVEVENTIIKRVTEQQKIKKLNNCCNLENNIAEYAKIQIATMKPIGIGDKLAGRHGNKGVVSNIIPLADTPYLPDGTPINIIFNSLGLPNRLNIGQILESTAGLSVYILTQKVQFLLRTDKLEEAKQLIENYLKFKIHRDSINVEEAIEVIKQNKCIRLKLPVFDSISFEELKAILRMLDVSEDATFRLRCGIGGFTNSPDFNRKIHVGIFYVMKLNHLADEKMAVRETGNPSGGGGYSAILKQPLPRKANYGGQRFGEMEGWAMEAYGASYTLLEILGPKSDDVVARNQLYSSIFTRDFSFKKHLSAIVTVLIKYINGACLKLKFIQSLSAHLRYKN